MTAPQINLLDPDFYLDPYATYATLRADHPILWDEANGLWGVFRLDDIVDIERRKEEFSNAGDDKGGYRPLIRADRSIIGLDDPQHSVRRRLVARQFTPRAVTRLGDLVREAATDLLDRALAHGGSIEVVSELAAPLPATIIGKLIGFPDDKRDLLADWANRTVSLGGGPPAMNEDGMIAAMEFAQFCADAYEDRLDAEDRGDLLSLWIAAEREGLSDDNPFGLDEIISDCLLLLDGGAETTRSTIGRILMELADRPDQWALLKAGADLDMAVEEFIRWVTPVHNMCRVATVDAIVGDTTIRAGEQVMLQYGSANRDLDHFDDPETFDVTRNPNHHIAFGHGTHFCLGAALARQEIRIFFEQLLARVDTLSVHTPIEEHATAFVRGIRSGRIDIVPSQGATE